RLLAAADDVAAQVALVDIRLDGAGDLPVHARPVLVEHVFEIVPACAAVYRTVVSTRSGVRREGLFDKRAFPFDEIVALKVDLHPLAKFDTAQLGDEETRLFLIDEDD